MNPANRLILATLGLVLLAPVGEPVQAQDKARTVQLQVWAIRATTRNKEISPELKSIAELLKKHAKYTGFKLEARRSGSAELEQKFSAPLVGPYHVEITPKSHDGKRVQFQLTLLRVEDKKKTPVLNTTVTLNEGKFQLIAGPELDQGDVLIIAVSAR